MSIHAIAPSQLPDATKPEMDFTESSFFQEPNRSLPTPAEVRASSTDIELMRAQPAPVIFEDRNLLVKFGPHVTVTEAQCLWMLKRVFHDGSVPVPEVFGWRVEEKDVYIYMELIRGETLLDRWDGLNDADKESLRGDLCRIVERFGQLQCSDDEYIGSVSRQHLLDYVFLTQPKGGPFSTIKEFNDWFAFLHQIPFPNTRYDDPVREMLPDTGEIKFTHGDLHRGNIIVSPVSSAGPARVLAIIDWAHAGWYPDYWEYCKAVYTTWAEDEWCQEWVNKFLSPRMDDFMVFSHYTMAMGSV